MEQKQLEMRYASEPGTFRVYIGTDSDTDNQALFNFTEKDQRNGIKSTKDSL